LNGLSRSQPYIAKNTKEQENKAAAHVGTASGGQKSPAMFARLVRTPTVQANAASHVPQLSLQTMQLQKDSRA
jgi:hypothetical protein